MKLKSIRRWVGKDLATAEYFRNKDGSLMSLVERLALASDDPSFGWRLARAEVLSGKRLPYTLKNVNLLRAEEYLLKRAGNSIPAHLEDYVVVDMLMHPAKRWEREVLNALLISKDITIADIAQTMGLPVTAIEIYSDICFSVRDRFKEPAYLAKLVYPENQTDNLPRELSLLRAGYRHGAAEVLLQAGLVNTRTDRESPDDLCGEIEREVMTQALSDVRAGRMDSSAAKHAFKQLAIRAENDERNGRQIPDHEMGLMAVGVGFGIIDTVKRIQGPEIQKRLNIPEGAATKNQIADLVNGTSTTSHK